MYTCWRSLYPLSQVFFILPFFMVAAGGILFFNGLQIYGYYQIRDIADDLPENLGLYDNVRVMQRIRVVCGDVTRAYRGPPELINLDIHDSDSFIPIEFAGAAASVVFYVRDAAIGMWLCPC